MKYSNANFLESFRLKYTKLLILKSIFIFLIFSCARSNQEDALAWMDVPIVGASQTENYLHLLEGKKIGVVTNQSGRIDETHLVDSLLALNVNIVRVFSPEHGFRGDADAGEHVNNQVDKKTGLQLISLYGTNKKPTKSQLDGLEVLVFDIQDVGVRFYTYISTLHYVMQACAENNIKLIVLDRPNPNGSYVDGPVLDTNFTSFVGMHTVPIVHGMTIGEYAKMINGEGWLGNDLVTDLKIIPLANYSHDSYYSLPVPPSPNLRSDLSIQLYPSLCLFEATTVSIGRGTEFPFEIYGHPAFKSESYSFVPKSSFGAKSPKMEGETCKGYRLSNNDLSFPRKFELSFLINACQELEGQKFIETSRFFNLLAGNDVLQQQLIDHVSEEEIRASWSAGLEEYRKIRLRYLLYP